MKLARRDIKLIIVLISIAIFVGAYLGIYLRFSDLTGGLESEIESLEPRLEQLQGYYDHLTQYEKEIADSNSAISSALKIYPNDVRAEDGIMFAVDMERSAGLAISSANFTEPEPIMELRSIAEDANGAYTPAMLHGYRRSITYGCTFTYQELKKAINFINAASTCTKLNTVNVSYDGNTGELIGSVAIDKYFITGADDEYHPTKVPSMSLGTNNIFGTVITPED